MSSQVLESVRTLAEKVATAQDVEVYHVELSGSTVRVLVEGPQGTSLGACSRFSQELSGELDRAGLFQGRYFIEVSSPGIERRLYRPRDFERAVNRRIRVRTRSGPFEGVLVAADEKGLVINFEDKGKTHTGRVTYEDVKEARLAVPDSELFCKPVVTQHSAAGGAGPDLDAPGGKGTDE
jgi:ribosome maturation factor RimP